MMRRDAHFGLCRKGNGGREWGRGGSGEREGPVSERAELRRSYRLNIPHEEAHRKTQENPRGWLLE